MKIAVLPGDGIGPEIVREAVKVLNGLGESFEFEEAPIGGAGYDASGDPLPDATLAIAKQADAILLGATGDWKYDKLDRKLRPEQGMLRLRKELHFFANLRPAFLYEDLIGASPLKPEIAKGLDILLVRELNGDIYFGQPRGTRNAPDGEFAGAREGFDTMRYHYCPVKYRTNSTGYMATHRRCRRQRLERRGKAGFSRKSARIKSVGKRRATYRAPVPF